MSTLLRDSLSVLLTSCSTVACQLLTKHGLKRLAPLDLPADPLGTLAAVLTSPFILAGVAIQVLGFGIWLTVIARANLTWAVGVAGALTLLLTALLNWLMLGERVSTIQALGVVLLALGIVLLSVEPEASRSLAP